MPKKRPKKELEVTMVDASEKATDDLTQTMAAHPDSTDGAQETCLSNETIKNLRAIFRDFFKGKEGSVFIFTNVKEYTKKVPPKNDPQYLYKLSKTTIHYYEFKQTKQQQPIVFNIDQCKFKRQALNDNNQFAQEFLTSFFNTVQDLSERQMVFEERG